MRKKSTTKKPKAKARRTKARQILKHKYWHLTRRCTQRQYWLTPCPVVIHVMKYAIAAASARTNVEVIDWQIMSNHYHVVLFDPDGRAPEFAEHLNKTVARVLNVHWGRRENFWSSERRGLTELGTEEDVMDAIVYALANPVKAHLVERVAEWPGLSSWAYMDGQSETVERPGVFFRKDDGGLRSSAPTEVTLRSAQPRFSIERGESLDQWMDRKRKAVELRESELRAARPKDTKIVGRKAILAQKPSESPSTPEKRRKLNPAIACKDKTKRIELCLRLRGFREQYRKAFEDMRNRKDTAFPHGTYYYVRLKLPIRVDPEPKAA